MKEQRGSTMSSDGSCCPPSDVPVLLGVDFDGRVEAWISNRPGCVVFAECESEAVGRIPGAIRDYDEWLTRHGLLKSPDIHRPMDLQTPSAVRVNVRVVERVAVDEKLVHGNTAAFFDWDRQPTTTVEIEAALQSLTCSRQDLLDLLHRLPGPAWSQRPGHGRRTVTDILRHVANVEWWYVSRIVDFPVPHEGYPEDVLAFLAWTRERVAARLRSLSGTEREQISVPDRTSGELWSARKVLRRLLYHERYHIRQLHTVVTS